MTARVAAAIGVVAIVIAFVAFGGYGWVTGDGNIETFLTDTGALGPLVFVLVMWLTQPLGVPGFVYMVPAGIVWSWPAAIALSWIGNMGASYIAFVFARSLAREWVTARIPARLHTYDARLAAGGLAPVVVLRLLFGQLPPADWLLGVSKVTKRHFVIGTGIGIVPGIVALVVAGGGVVALFTDMSSAVQQIAIIAIAGALIALRLWRRRSVRRADTDRA